MKMASSTARRKATFREILRDTRLLAAQAAWERAYTASVLRRNAVIHRDSRSTKLLSNTKLSAIRLACALAPELFRIQIDDDYHIGLPCVRWADGRALHIPFSVLHEIERQLMTPVSAGGQQIAAQAMGKLRCA